MPIRNVIWLVVAALGILFNAMMIAFVYESNAPKTLALIAICIFIISIILNIKNATENT